MAESQKTSPRSRSRWSRWVIYCLGVLTGCLCTGVVVVFINRTQAPMLNDRFIARDELSPLQKDEKWDPNTVLTNTANSMPNTMAKVDGAVSMPNAESVTTTAVSEKQSSQLGSVLKSRSGGAVESLPKSTAAGSESVNPEQAGLDKLVSSVTSFQTGEANATHEYFLQVGAFRNAQEAQAQRTQLELSGVKVQVKETQSGGSALYRVQVGPLVSTAEVQKAKQQISALGLSSFEVTAR